MGRKKAPPLPTPPPATMVPVPAALLEAVRATHPIAYDWTAVQIVTGCLALVIKLSASQPLPASLYERTDSPVAAHRAAHGCGRAAPDLPSEAVTERVNELEAVAAERERIAQLAEHVSALYPAPRCDHPEHWGHGLNSFADLVRAEPAVLESGQ